MTRPTLDKDLVFFIRPVLKKMKNWRPTTHELYTIFLTPQPTAYDIAKV